MNMKKIQVMLDENNKIGKFPTWVTFFPKVTSFILVPDSYVSKNSGNFRCFRTRNRRILIAISEDRILYSK